MVSRKDFTDELEQLLTELVQRRRRLYPHVERLVLDYELTRSRSSRRLSVVSIVASTGQECVGALKVEPLAAAALVWRPPPSFLLVPRR